MQTAFGTSRFDQADLPETTATWTRASPENPIAFAPTGVRSMMRPLMYGPRSLMRTITDWPLPMFVTFTFVPKGSVRALP